MRCPYKVRVRKTGFDCINEGLLSVSQDIDRGMTALDLLLRYCFISFIAIRPSKRSITDLTRGNLFGVHLNGVPLYSTAVSLSA